MKMDKIVAEIRSDEGLRFFEGGVVGTLRTIDACGDKVVVELEQVGQIDGTFESTGRVYSANGLCPTINTMGGGDRQPKIAIPQATAQGFAECEIGGVCDLSYPDSKTRRGRVQEGGRMCPTITAESNGLCRIEPYIAAMRGRNPDKPTSRQSGLPTEQMLEIKDDGTSNTLTTVQKDNLVIEPHFRVRKLTPLECWRLMGFTDDDFHKAKKALNETFYKGRDRSNSQLYKQAGNSIVVQVLMAIKKQMLKRRGKV